MKFQLIHESNGRMRIHILPGISLAQADMLQYWLEKLPGTKRAIVHERTGNAIIEYRPPQTRNQLIAELSRFSFSDLKPNEIASIHSARALNREYEEKLVMRVLGKVFRRLFFPPALRACWSTLHGLPYLWRALQCLLHGRLQVELLDGISIGLSLFRKDFTTAGSVRFLLSLGSLLEEWTHKKSVSDLARSMSLNVDRVWRIQNDQEALVPLTDIEPGDVILIRVGGMIPIDGEIIDGDVMVNQASLTGESVPVSKHPGTRVYAGTIIEEGECTIRVMHETGSSRYDKIVEMIEASERLKSTAEQTASNLADKLVPYTLAGSALTYLLTRNPTRALSILMVDFSCALKLAMPLSVLSAIRELSSAHITVKGGKFLEATAKADTIVFDKTGTLTHACPTLADIITFGDHDPDEMLRIAACLEEHFPHSMAMPSCVRPTRKAFCMTRCTPKSNTSWPTALSARSTRRKCSLAVTTSYLKTNSAPSQNKKKPNLTAFRHNIPSSIWQSAANSRQCSAFMTRFGPKRVLCCAHSNRWASNARSC